MSVEKPPTSEMASVAPSNRSGLLSTDQRAPYVPPASSSAKKANTRSRLGLRPSLPMDRMTDRIMASMSFMSTAPRPQTTPSRTSPPNGSTLQSCAWAGTTSKCPWTTSAGSEELLPSMRLTTLARPGADSYSSADSPASEISAAVCSAMARSPGPSLLPKLLVSKRMRSEQMPATSSSGLMVFTGTLLSAWRSLQPTVLVDSGSWRTGKMGKEDSIIVSGKSHAIVFIAAAGDNDSTERKNQCPAITCAGGGMADALA